MHGARWLLVLGLAVAAAVAVVPITGSNITESGGNASCGPAAGVAMGLTEPRDPDRLIPLSPGGDVALSARAWCQQEAGRWLRRGVAVSGALLGLAAVLGAGRLLLGARAARLA